MQDLPAQVEATLRQSLGIGRGAILVVAVSGGLDSCVLLHLLNQSARALQHRLVVAHFNHQLRASASARDEALVRRMARRLGWPCEVGCGNVRSWSKQHGVSLEMAARTLRHEFLARVARQHGASRVATAHHADDQVELFFLRLLRGSAPDGLAGMASEARSPADRAISLLRPLLGFSKAELRDYARQHRIRFREDESNRLSLFQRNRIRRRLLPLLRKSWQPALNRVVLRAMSLLADESNYIEQQARQWIEDRHPAPFGALHPALQRAIIVAQLIRLGVDPDYECVEALRCCPGVPRTVPKGRVLNLNRLGQLRLVAPSPSAFAPGSLALDLEGASTSTAFNGVVFSWETRRGRNRPRPASGQECFDADRVGRRIILRHWRAGDRFQPLGLGHSQKLHDWFINRKVPREQRRRLILATTESGEIFWIEGQRIAETFQVTRRTKRLLQWQWERLNSPVGGATGTAVR